MTPPPEASEAKIAPSPAAPSQGRRRALYGLNVAVAVVAAVAIVVLVNVLVDWQYRRLPAALKDMVRFDLTATRAYTLAPQTRSVLADLEGDHRIVAVLRVDDKNGQDAADLLQQYARYGSNISVDIINPDRELPRLESFYSTLETRFTEETAPLRAAVEAGLRSLDALADDLASLRETFAQLAADESLDDDSARETMRLFDTKLGQVEAAYRDAGRTLRESLSKPMPPWSNARADLVGALRKAEAEVLSPYQQEFARRSRDRGTPMAVRDALMRMDAPIEAMRQRVRPAVEALLLPAEPVRYNRLLETLRAGEVAVVLGPDAERVVPIGEMFVADAGGGEARFVGEDRLTGALLTMRVAQPPRIIFVHDMPTSVVTPRGGLSHVAGRVLMAGFEVAEWALGEGNAPSGSGGAGAGVPGGETAATVAPPPNPARGQRAVWIVPALSLDRTTQADRDLVADVLERRLAAGDGVMLCFNYDAEALYRPADPLMALAGDWGIRPRMHEMLLREGLGSDGQTRPEAGWAVRTWPEDSPLASALAGREAQFVAVSPLTLEPRPGVETTPVAAAHGRRVWTATGLTTPEQIAASSYDRANDADGAFIAAAAWRIDDRDRAADDGGRLLAFTERHWLSDRQAGRRLGNSELFMNSVYWLAGLDEAIAATPRTQDVRRIEAMSQGRELGYRVLLLAGLPGLALLGGVGVWAVRRRD